MDQPMRYTFAVFEIIPLERLGLEKANTWLQNLSNALKNVGFLPIEQDKNKTINLFELKDQSSVEQLSKEVLVDDELVWLVTEFYQHLIIIPTGHDILFGFASTKDPNEMGGPYSRPPEYISSEVGGPIYPPSIPRILCAGALKQSGLTDFGEMIDCITNFPRETALGGSITFVDAPIEFNLTMRDESRGFKWRTLSILSSNLLLTQSIIDVLQDKKLIDQIEIAKGFPCQIFSVSDQLAFSLFNSYWIKARFGTLFEVLDEMLGISLHLNWSLAKTYTEKLSKEEAISYALAQNTRLKQIEEKENAIRYSLSLLQKKYRSKSQLVEWEVNGLYSNIVRYSPVYLVWKSHLNAFIQNERTLAHQLRSLIGNLDWSSLDKNGLASVNDAEKIIQLLEIDPASTLTKMRVIIEKIISCLFNHEFPAQKAPLFNMIEKLNNRNIFPPFIHIYLNTLRLSGNIGAHKAIGTREDVEAIVPIFVRVVEWFIDTQLGIT